jgi:integrase
LLNQGGLPINAKHLNQRFGIVTRRELGRQLNLHLFRKIAATELAIHDPAHADIAQILLGHSSYDTTQEHYNLGQVIDAARTVQDTISGLRDRLHNVPGVTHGQPPASPPNGKVA